MSNIDLLRPENNVEKQCFVGVDWSDFIKRKHCQQRPPAPDLPPKMREIQGIGDGVGMGGGQKANEERKKGTIPLLESTSNLPTTTLTAVCFTRLQAQER